MTQPRKCTFHITSLILLLSTFLIAACTDNTTNDSDAPISNDASNINTALSSLPLEVVSTEEAEGLYYMREEEKLAHDVYSTLYTVNSKTIFDNISDSEQTHTEAIKLLLERYSLTEPVTDASIGTFQNSFLQSLYDSLVARGSLSLIDALIVGATIEEIDIIDIQNELDNNVDNQDIALVYENLLKGSRNHLRSFTQNLTNQGVIYTPQYLDQVTYDSIVSTPTETGN